MRMPLSHRHDGLPLRYQRPEYVDVDAMHVVEHRLTVMDEKAKQKERKEDKSFVLTIDMIVAQ